MKQLLLYYYTLKHLKIMQLFYRVYYFILSKINNSSLPQITSAPKTNSLVLNQPIFRYTSLCGTSFTFLNLTRDFNHKIDWDYEAYGKLWCYNLNYFDFINQEEIDPSIVIALINDFIRRKDTIRTGFEPYPISLRIINWIKFIVRHDIKDDNINTSLYQQATLLSKKLEYHLLGNHLLENGFALLFAGTFFNNETFLSTARRILRKELNEQILPDGAHFELSPMYHQIILDRLLDCVNLLQQNGNDPLLPFLIDKSTVMLGWLRQMTFRDGSIPLVNDATVGIAPTSRQLFEYSCRLGLVECSVPLRESGYRKIERDRYEMIIDVGKIGPDYIPGHAHSDTFNFVLYADGIPLIVDTGISTYESNGRRLMERQTAAHNTVTVNDLEQSEVWGSFRVARRAYVVDLHESECSLGAAHTGYDNLGVRHHRHYSWADRAIIITDTIVPKTLHEGCAYFHFPPDVDVTLDGSTAYAGSVQITFIDAAAVILKDYSAAKGFNVIAPAKVLTVTFTTKLTTLIELNTQRDISCVS